jgi:hypothetical protein
MNYYHVYLDRCVVSFSKAIVAQVNHFRATFGWRQRFKFESFGDFFNQSSLLLN